MNRALTFAFASTRRRMYAGPLGPCVDEFITELQDRDYAEHTIRCKVGVVADFSRWLHRRRLQASAVDTEHIELFIAYRDRAGRLALGDAKALQQMEDLLRQKQITQPDVRLRKLSERERVEQDFRLHLLQGKGLASSTPVCYLRHVSKFLRERFQAEAPRFEELVRTDVIRFIQCHTCGCSYSRAQQIVTALRAFLRYLRLRGLIAVDLADTIPRVARWSMATLPVLMRHEQVTRVLERCDRKTAVGRRDYAILLLLARLGLRAGEVIALTLDQIDWQQGVLTLRGKSGAWTRMPLPHDVGKAIADYLKHGRPSCIDRRVFIRAHAPRTGFRSASRISVIASRALRRAQIDLARTGAHVFRHALATQMLRQGASLSQIGDLLRHEHPDTTRIYAKVDLTSLRALAMAWPGGVR